MAGRAAHDPRHGSRWLNPVPFLQHLPPWVPAAEAVILGTGVLEVLLGLALLLRPPWRRRAGLALAASLLAPGGPGAGRIPAGAGA